ncbi:MAG: hypothetical protein ACI9TY_001547 [Alphaproteobacteria bacterium]|jgi:hypothetical protein
MFIIKRPLLFETLVSHKTSHTNIFKPLIHKTLRGTSL